MAVLLRALRALFPLLRLQPWLLSAMIILGVLAALSEGALHFTLHPACAEIKSGHKRGRRRAVGRAFAVDSVAAPTLVDRYQHCAMYGVEERSRLIATRCCSRG